MINTEINKKIAVIGSGVAGICAAHLLSKKHAVTLFEAEERIGGHTNTIETIDENNNPIAIDTGFIVCNTKNYPNFHKFLRSLNVPVRNSDMSFGYYDTISKFTYAGTTINGLFADRKNLFSPNFWSFLFEIKNFCQQGLRNLQNKNLSQSQTVEEYFKRYSYTDKLLQHYISPMAGSIWSASGASIKTFPILTLLSFFYNHGLLSIKNRPQWQTVIGGSYSYLKAFEKQFNGTIIKSSTVNSVIRDSNSVKIFTKTNEYEFDNVIMAVHADQVLNILKDASTEEQKAFSPWVYELNDTYLHFDESFLPPNKRAWASWNYIRDERISDSHVSITYHMNRLQGLRCKRNFCVTLNPSRLPDKNKTICRIEYTHPQFTTDTLKTQSIFPTLQGQQNSYFCGSYQGYGFHEDAVTSAVNVAKHFSIDL